MVAIEHQSEKIDGRSTPLVSAILPARNEEGHIKLVLQSLMCQETPNFTLEIIVVDGDSSDATKNIVKQIADEDTRIKLAINYQQKTPYAFNIGIQLARGKYICILGGHTVYAKNYIAMCLEELHLQGAGGCSGHAIVRPGNNGLQAKLVAWALAHPFGTSTGSTRTHKAGFADTIPYPIFLKSTLLEVGGYDTQLHRNQDNDLSQRLRARGHKLYITDRTFCEYFVSPSLMSLSRYALKTGFWNIISLRKNHWSMSLRHFVPGLFVASLLLCFLLFLSSFYAKDDLQPWLRSPLILLGMTYGTLGILAACYVSIREKSIGALLLPIVFLILHVSYGVGSLIAIMSNARLPPSSLRRDQDVAEYS
jgi:succinoglycan biosynthesis protein ExoA